MNWQGGGESVHHRTETSFSDYINSKGFTQAAGGLLGDSSIKLRYLYKDVEPLLAAPTIKKLGNFLFMIY